MPKPINMEWRAYDTNQLTVVYAEHIGPLIDDGYNESLADPNFATCETCYHWDRAPTCDVDMTDAYRNLTRNLAVAIALAAAVDRAEAARGWRGPRRSDLREDGATLRHAVPAYRWPYCMPDQHQSCCKLYRPGGRYCDCTASDESDQHDGCPEYCPVCTRGIELMLGIEPESRVGKDLNATAQCGHRMEGR